MDFKQILEVIAMAGKKRETVEIYYPRTEKSVGGWREVEPYSLATDVGSDGEHLVYGKDRMSPGHIFNGYTVGSYDDHCDSFIIGKIREARFTGKKFRARKKWKIEF